MELTDRELKLEDQGEDVRLLQSELADLGLAIPVAERQAAIFGRGTQRVVVAIQRRLGLKASGTVDQETAARINRELEGGGGQPPNGDFVVRGRVVHAGGEPLDGAIVRAFDRDLRSEQALGETSTDAGGRYEIRYASDRFAANEEGSADLVVRAFGPDGRERAASPVHFNAASEETVDLIVDGQSFRGQSEWELLLAHLSPLLEGLPFADLTEDDEHQDVTFLTGETGEDVGRITLLVAAHRMMAATDIAAEAFYSMLRQGLPTSLELLLAQDPEVQRGALVRSAEANVVPGQVGDNADAIVDALRAAAARLALGTTELDAEQSSSWGQVIASALGEPQLREEFVTAYLAHVGSIQEFWAGIAQRPEFSDRLEELQLAVQLGTLAANHMPLVDELQAMRANGEVISLAELSRFDEAAWREILSRDPGSGTIGAPEQVPGDSPEEKLNNYARGLALQVEDAFTTAFVARRLETDDLAGREDLVRFLDANGDFDLRSSRVSQYLEEHPDAFAGVGDPERARADLQALQRVYRLAPRYEQASTMLKAGIDSAHAIARMGRNVFVARFGESLGGTVRARQVYAKAEHVRALSLNLAVEYGLATLKAPMTVAPDEAVLEVDGVPDWSTLFGSLELCGCDQCRSVHSPAAYLADMLHFLSERPARVAGSSALDVLFARRPDLGDIELTCENTNTPVPCVDLVDEALERAVAPPSPFTPFDLPSTADNDLDAGTLSQALREAFDPVLSTEAVISVGAGPPRDEPPDHWTIDEPAYTYSIRKSDGELHVVARSLQTKGSATERAAEPQYIDAAAYDVLAQTVWPWSLPFHLWAEEAAAYLDHLGVSRSQLREHLLAGARADVLADGDLGVEQLGLTRFAANVITGAVTTQPGSATPGPWNLWGFDTDALTAQSSIPDPADMTRRIASGNWLDVLGGRVDVFLQQSGLTYRDLLQVLDTYYVNPTVAAGRAIRLISTDPDDPATCETQKLSLPGLDATAAARAVRFIRLWRALGWSIRDVDRAITAFAPAAPDDAFLIRLSHVKRLQSRFALPVVRLLGWWAPLDTAGYIDYDVPGQPSAASLYDQLFRDPTTVNPPDPAFTEDPAALSGTLTGRPGLSTALGIDAADMSRLISDAAVIPRAAANPALPDDRLTLANLSRLHRHASMARALGLRIRDYLTACALIGGDPFASTTATLLFVEAVDTMLAGDTTVAELDYLLRHVSTPEAPVAPATETIAIMVDELRSGLGEIAERNTFRTAVDDPAGPTVDLTGDLTRERLALLNWEPALVDQAVATLSGTVVYETPLASLPAGVTLPNTTAVTAVALAALPAGVTIPAELTDVVAHDAGAGELRALRELDPGERARLSAAAAASGDAPFVAAVAALLLAQDELRGAVVYDAQQRVLRFTGPMTARRRTRLDAVSADPAYTAAVAELFDGPRRFVRRSMPTFSVGDFSAELAALPTAVAIPAALRRKLRFDATATPGRVRFLGAMSEAERDSLLALSSNPADPQDAAYRAAVQSLYAAPEAVVPARGDQFLTASGAGNDAAALFDNPVAPGDRFAHVLRALLPHLRTVLSERLAIQTMAEALGLEARSTEALLRDWLASPVDADPDPARRRRCLAELIDGGFVASDPTTAVTPTTFPAQFRTFLRAHKASLVAQRLQLGHEQLGWLFSYGTVAGWLDLNALPTRSQDPAAPIEGWLRLVRLAAVRDGLAQGERALAALLARGHAVGAGAPDAQLNAGKTAWFAAATAWTPWSGEDLAVLLGARDDHTDTGALDVAFPDGYRGAELLTHLRDVFALLRRLGIGAEQATGLAFGPVTQADARGVRQAVRSKYSEEQWLTLAKPLRDMLRARQRAALVAYLVANLELPFTQQEIPHPALSEGASGPAVRELQQKLNAAGASPAVAMDGTFASATRVAVVAFQNANGLAADGTVAADTWALLDRVRRSLRDADDLYAHLLMDVQMAPA